MCPDKKLLGVGTFSTNSIFMHVKSATTVLLCASNADKEPYKNILQGHLKE